MAIRDKFCIVFGRKSSFPYKLCNEILFSKNFIANFL